MAVPREEVTSLIPVRRIMNDRRRTAVSPDTPSSVGRRCFLAARGPLAKTRAAASESRPGRGGQAQAARAAPTRSRALPAWPRVCDQVKRALGPRAPPSPPTPKAPLCFPGNRADDARDGPGRGISVVVSVSLSRASPCPRVLSVWVGAPGSLRGRGNGAASGRRSQAVSRCFKCNFKISFIALYLLFHRRLVFHPSPS